MMPQIIAPAVTAAAAAAMAASLAGELLPLRIPPPDAGAADDDDKAVVAVEGAARSIHTLLGREEQRKQGRESEGRQGERAERLAICDGRCQLWMFSLFFFFATSPLCFALLLSAASLLS